MKLEFYKPPFTDKYKCGYIYDANSNFMFQFETYNVELYIFDAFWLYAKNGYKQGYIDAINNNDL